jgi:hypothetical protein
MKKSIPILALLAAALAAPCASADEGGVVLQLRGDAGPNAFAVSVGAEGASYVVASNAPLEAGGSLCSHPEADPQRLECPAAGIAGFEVNAGGGDDRVVLARGVTVPATLRGGSGDDRLVGGAAADRLVGGPGADTLIGRAGDDWLFGGPGPDRLLGGPGDDRLVGGPGHDVLVGGPGHNKVS